MRGSLPGVTAELVPGTRAHREFVRVLSAEVFARFGDYDVTLPGLIGLPWIRTVIALVDDKPVGFAMVSLERLGDAEIDLVAIAVTPLLQRRGVGRRLLEHVEERARAAASDRPCRLTLTVAEDNLPARLLFERAGFSIVADEPGRYQGGQSSIRMHKTLGL